MPLLSVTSTHFNGKRRIDWMRTHQVPGEAAKLGPGAYSDSNGIRAVTLFEAVPQQALSVSVCGAAGLPCNLRAGMHLLLASNTTAAPLRCEWSQGVRSVGAFVIAQAAPNTPIKALMWIRLAGSADFVSSPIDTDGVTGPVVQTLNDPVAPFVGARATGNDLIEEVVFDVVHPTNQSLSPIGIGPLYFGEQ